MSTLPTVAHDHSSGGEAGNTFNATLTVEVRIPDGTVVFTASYDRQGTRLEAGSPAPLGTPVRGIPAP